MLRKSICTLVAAISFVSIAHADEVVLSNGDRITGTIANIAGGKMKFTSTALGDLMIDMANVKSYTTDEPATIQLTDRKQIQGKVTAADAEKTTVEGNGDIPAGQINQINPPAQKWTGALVVNGSLARGNTHSENLGISLDAVLRRDNPVQDDRFTIGAGYSYGRDRDTTTGESNTSTDNLFALGKYDKFFDAKFYGYGMVRYDHDRIADLTYRVAPGVGLGYQFVETPTFNLSGEAGVSYVFEEYDPGGDDSHIALRLAGHVDKKLNNAVTLFGDIEWLPAFDDPSDYNLHSDAGIRATMIQNMFAEFKIQYDRDSTPAPNADKNDIKFLLGVGWHF
ncbi:MAG TPA: DUF481 domain-containing protein [Tepidisphaeraceae bacterium]|jgi:putative salt-induced outer membrane protein YdiY|nr:DUF481 domain-containing protein [Tepidisphaeraceae bacterium]